MSRQINAPAVALVKHFESLFLEAYRCPAGVWTIGYGHTGMVHQDGTVFPGRRITAAEAEELLRHDMTVFSAGVEKLLLKRPLQELNDNQFGALVSFGFNVGLGNLGKSTLLARINARRYADAPAEFLKWTRANGKILRGLVRRRQSEANLWQLAPGADTARAMLWQLPSFIVRP